MITATFDNFLSSSSQNSPENGKVFLLFYKSSKSYKRNCVENKIEMMKIAEHVQLVTNYTIVL